MNCRITLSVSQIAKNWSAWIKSEEVRQNWIDRFDEENDGIRKNLEAAQKDLNDGKEDWHREWAEGRIEYLKREIKKRERYIRQIEALQF